MAAVNERDLFIEALPLPAADREAYLTAACGEDGVLRDRVLELLAQHGRDASVLRRPANERFATRDDSHTVEIEKAAPYDALCEFLSPSTHPDSLGRFGQYELLKVLGEGGFGIVLKAFDDSLHRVVAIKVLHPSLARTSPPRKRFLREARAAAAVKHEHIVQVYAVHEDPLPHLAMEYIEGRSLQDLMDANGPLEPAEIVRLGRQMALGLASAHEKGLVHRDIKPANLLIEDGTEPKIKLTDFGLARTNDAASITQSGVIAGTPLYMAPEQVQGEPLDARTDLFSLGSVFYAMCVGHPPFRASTMIAVLKRVADDEPRPIREIIPEVPEGLVAVVRKLLAKDPADRFASATEVAAALENCLTATPAAVKPPKKDRGFRWAWGAVAAALIVGAGFVAWPRTTAKTPLDAPLNSVSPATMAPPAKPTWERETAALPMGPQIAAVKAKLREANPQFDMEKVKFETKDGVVVYVRFESAMNLYDFRPLRALPQLRRLYVNSYDGKPDMTTLAGLPLTHLDFNGSAFRDLSPLRGMPLEFVNVWSFGGDSLAPLAGMPIREMNCGASNVKDLSPLAGMPLEILTLNLTQVEDVTPLAEMPLRILLLQNTKVRSIEPLAKLKLTKLCLNGSPIADYSPLAGMPTLEDLELDYDPAKHWKLLRDLPNLKTINFKPAAEFLNATDTPAALPEQEWLATTMKLPEVDRWPKVVARLQALNPKWNAEGTKKSVSIRGEKVFGYGLKDAANLTDISPVKALPDIEFIDPEGPMACSFDVFRGFKLTTIYGQQAKPDVAPLAGMPLKILWLFHYRGNWEPVYDMPLEDFRVSGSTFPGFDRLKNARLRTVYAVQCPIADLAGLQGHPLELLDIRGTAVKDLSPLKGCRTLKSLRLWGTKVSDLTPIQDLPIELLSIEDVKRHHAVLKAMPNLKTLNDRPKDEVLQDGDEDEKN